MEFNWSTFVLEIINFLVLVWILKHFLYRPVLNMIAERRRAIESQLAEAKNQQAEADTLKEQYTNRLAEWELERQEALNELHHELEQERLDRLENLRQELAQEQQKIQITRLRQDNQTLREIEQRALQQAAQFASRLLAEAAGPELETRLFELMLDGLNELSSDQISGFGNKWEGSPESIQVSSAYPLTEKQRQLLEETLHRVSGLNVPLQYQLDNSLRAGLSVAIGAWVLQLNVRDELHGFAELSDVDG